MKKFSKEYAEELAKKDQDSFYEDRLSDGYLNGVSDYKEGYMKAIEETNAKELLEALIELKKDIEADGYNYRLATMNKVDNAINKATK